MQLLILIPSIEKENESIENNKQFYISTGDDCVFTINNQEAICPIIFNKRILYNYDVIDLLNFVTSTSIIKNESEGIFLTTGLFNQVTITKFK